MPLPGNVGVSQNLTQFTPSTLAPAKKADPEVLSASTNYERQIEILKQSIAGEDDYEDLKNHEIEELLMDIPKASDILECTSQDCPLLVRKGKQKIINIKDSSSTAKQIVDILLSDRFCQTFPQPRCHLWSIDSGDFGSENCQ